MKIDDRYQGHAEALSKAGLAPKVYPTLNEICLKAYALKLYNDAKREKKVEGENVVRIFV